MAKTVKKTGDTKALLRVAIAEQDRIVENCKDSTHPAIKETCVRAKGRRDAFRAALDSLEGSKKMLRYYGESP